VVSDENQDVARVAQGDRAAYARLVNLHLRSIEAYALRTCGNRATAEDVVQEVMLRLWLRADQFQPERARLTTWLHQMAHNLCIDHLRRNSRFVDLQAADHGQDVTETLSTQVSYEGSLVSEAVEVGLLDERADTVQVALSKLPERQRNALVLTYYQGLSNAEVAEVMQAGVRAIESLLVRARAALKRQLELTDDDQ
jgi:RNA polymerase sigma-70 factor (ECF subfamily)